MQNTSNTKPMVFATQPNQTKNLHLINENFRYGYTDESGNIIIPAVFQYAKKFINHHAIIYYNRKVGNINMDGTELTQFKYQNIKNFSERLVAVCLQNKWGYINAKGEETITCQYHYAGHFHNQMAIVGINNKYGIINTTNEIILPLQYEDVQLLSKSCIAYRKKNKWTIQDINKRKKKEVDYFSPIEGIAGFYLTGSKNTKEMMFGISDSTGEYKIEPVYYTLEICPAHQLIKAAIKDTLKNIKYGIINFENQIVTPFIFDRMGDYSKGIAIVKINQFFGIINKEKYIMIKDLQWLESEGSYFKIFRNKNVGILNDMGKIIIDPKYSHIEIAENYFFITEKGKTGIWNNNGRCIHKAEYDKIFKMNDTLFLANENNNWLILGSNGDKKNLAKYQNAEILSPKYIRVKLKFLYGVIDERGVEIIPCKYSEIMIGDNDIFTVCVNDKWGFINNKNKTLIEFKFDKAGAFSNGLAWFQNQNCFGYIDISGHSVIPAQYEAAKPYINQLAAVKLKNKWGFVDYAGNMVIPCKFDCTESFTNKVANAQIKGKKVLIYADGKIVKN